MKLLEYEAKQILANFNIPVPKSEVIDSTDQISLPTPLVLKSQVPVGGRGKAGGVKVINEQTSLRSEVNQIINLSISGFRPKKLLVEELVDIKRELYLSILINRDNSSIELLAHPEGGVEVESSNDDQLLRLEVSAKQLPVLGEILAEHYELEENSFMLQDLIEKLYRCFIKSDALLLEINPLILTNTGELIAGDCKLELDSDASFRHPNWDFEQGIVDRNFVVLDPDGTIATIANGAGLAMATVDAVAANGRQPANFLDIGGAATVDSITKSFQNIAKLEKVDTIIINIFGGIVRCDTVAQAIITAKDSLSSSTKLAVRLSGNKSDEAGQLLAKHDIKNYDSLEQILEELA